MSYDAFRTDPKLETKGVWVDYGQGFRLLLARAGGANARYTKLFEKKAKPIRRALVNGQVSKEQGDDLLREIFSETVILSWEVKTADGKWKKGVEDPDTGETLKAEPSVYCRVLGHPELSDLFGAIQEDATGLQLFLKDVRALEAKN